MGIELDTIQLRVCLLTDKTGEMHIEHKEYDNDIICIPTGSDVFGMTPEFQTDVPAHQDAQLSQSEAMQVAIIPLQLQWKDLV